MFPYNCKKVIQDWGDAKDYELMNLGKGSKIKKRESTVFDHMMHYML